jgi:NitT/TauT family transport system substrate-binding protein
LFALDFLTSGQHSPFFVALDKGHYAEARLAVQIDRGFGSGDTVRRIGSKQATFGFADTGALVAGAAEGIEGVKVVAMIYTNSPVVIAYNPQRGISEPADLVGKTLTGFAAGSPYILWPAFAAANDLDEASVEWLLVDPAAVNSTFISGQADGAARFLFEVPQLADATKEDPNVDVEAMLYADYGVPIYGNAVIAHEDTINENPDLVRRFVAATLAGYVDALGDHAATSEIFAKYHRDTAPPIVIEQLAHLEDVVFADGITEDTIGTVDADKMARTVDILTDALNIDAEVNPDDLYTNDFLPSAP